ncbi:MAG: hypothetical protein GY756_06795 [bacterium]|nr:hypothetical protein [bacterium]
MNTVPLISLKGSHEEIGYQYGIQLKNRIHKTVESYSKYFKCTKAELSPKADYFKNKILEFNPDYVTEIEAISKGAEISSQWIYALNARSEILALEENECTAVYYKKTSLLGQNWDWDKDLEDLMVLLKIEHDSGHKILMMTEPGILGKIGLNSSGIGCTLNILRRNKKLDGVPVHIVLRSILDSSTFEYAKSNIFKSGFGRASNIILGCKEGSCYDIEFAGDENFEFTTSNDSLVHTNHYLAKMINPTIDSYNCSHARYDTAKDIIEKQSDQTIDDMKNLLLDRSNKDFPIQRIYKKGIVSENSGTVCSIIMDLKKNTVYFKKGNSTDRNFNIYQL